MKKIILLVFVLLLGGCSTTFAYKNANWLVHWYLDDYVEFTPAQEEQFDAMFATWIKWHKTEELPKYQAHLEDIMNDIKLSNINQDVIVAHRERARSHWVRARTFVADDIVTLATSLDDEQVIRFFAQLEKENREDEEELAERREVSEEKQAKNWTKRSKKNIRKWLGKLSQEQENIIQDYYGTFEATGDYWIDYKREYQSQLRNTFAMTERGDEFKQSLHDLIVDPEKYRSAGFQAKMDDNAITGANFMIALFNSSTQKQIDRLLSEIDEYREDIIDLQKE